MSILLNLKDNRLNAANQVQKRLGVMGRVYIAVLQNGRQLSYKRQEMRGNGLSQ